MSVSDEPVVMHHLGRNIEFDALEANREFRQITESVTSRENAIPVDLVWRNLTFDVPAPKQKKGQKPVIEPASSDGELPPGVAPLKPNMRRILHAVSGQVRSGQVLAIMGASGSGKTTMLNMLSGRLKSSSKCTTGGHVYVNGQSRNFTTFPHIAKFVEQDDTTMFAELTVHEQILFAARLALSSDVPEQRKQARVEKIIQELGLSKCRDTFIGNELTRGVSGGERRRVAIGVELVTDPSLIFLDEPTTGLDSFNALNVMSSLRHLAKNGRTIVTTIHQPRSSIFHLFDMLCLIAEGRTVYFGPAASVCEYFDGLGFQCPPHFNVADYVIDVLSVDHRTEEREVKTVSRIEYVSDHYRQNVEPDFLSNADAYQSAHSMQPTASMAKFGNGVFKEFTILVQRTSKLMRRERQINFTRLGQTLFFAILLGLIWLNSGRDAERAAVEGVLFFVVVNQKGNRESRKSQRFLSRCVVFCRKAAVRTAQSNILQLAFACDFVLYGGAELQRRGVLHASADHGGSVRIRRRNGSGAERVWRRRTDGCGNRAGGGDLPVAVWRVLYPAKRASWVHCVVEVGHFHVLCVQCGGAERVWRQPGGQCAGLQLEQVGGDWGTVWVWRRGRFYKERTINAGSGRGLRRALGASVVPDGSKNEAGKHANVPQDKQEPERVIARRALGPVREVLLNGGEEGLREARAVGERDSRGDGGRNDPAEEGECEHDGVELELDALGDLKLHARRGGAARRHGTRRDGGAHGARREGGARERAARGGGRRAGGGERSG
ncbi:ABC transporter-like protein [Gracilaria domingensis]|nr:ABC transporter-like protein [Gracilaria domingensis]